MHTTLFAITWLFHPRSDFETATYEQPHVVYRHQGPDTTIHSSNAYGVLIVIFLFPLTAYEDIVNPKS